MLDRWNVGLPALLALAAEQAGLVSRQQALSLGLTDGWLQHQVRAKRWMRVHAGVYATFTGALTWDARCWASLLRCGEGSAPAAVTALAGVTALHRWDPKMACLGATAREHDVVVAVERNLQLPPGSGIEVWMLGDLARYVHPARRPPVLRFEVAVLLQASRSSTTDTAISVIASASQSRRTTPARLRRVLEELAGNLRHRRFLVEILDDVATGAYSFLEVHYLRDVERPHGLPTGARQRRATVGRHSCYRDVEYVGLHVIVELDGRLGHEDFQSRADDMDRDTDAAREDARTARAGYLQVMSRRCSTAQRVADLLRLGGWADRPRRCGPGCPVH